MTHTVQEAYLACIIASVVQGTNQLHHVAHPVLWAGVEHVDIRMEERVAGVSHGIPSLPSADGNESIATCATCITGQWQAMQSAQGHS